MNAQFRKDTQQFLGDNKTLFEVYLPGTRHGDIISGSYALDIAKGRIAGHSVAFISGKAPSVASSDVPKTVWNVDGATYPWSAWNSTDHFIFLASDSASDTGTVLLSGLDNNYNPLTTTVVLTGTTPVSTTVKFKRLNSAIIISNTVTNVGTINIRTVSSSGTIVGRILPAEGQTSMGIYTIPAGFTGFSVYGDFSVSRNNAAQLAVRWRFFGGPFITVYRTEVYQQAFVANPMIPGAIPEKTDLDNMVQYVENAGTRVYSNQQLILVDNNFL